MFKSFAVLLVIFGGYVSVINVFALIKGRSCVPLLGGLGLFFGLYGFESTRPFAFLGFLVDWGTVLFVWAIPSLLYQWWGTSRRNLECHFTADDGGRKIEIMLFKSGKFTVDLNFDPPIAGENGAFVESRSKTGKWDQENGTFFLRDYEKERVLKIFLDGTVHRTLEEQVTSDQFEAFQLGNLILHKKS